MQGRSLGCMRSKALRRGLLHLVVVLISVNLHLAWVQAAEPVNPPTRIVYFIGDGMGFEHLELARIYLGRPLMVDTFPVTGSVTTHAANNRVTDSAAAATALAAGVKTNVGFLGVTPQGTNVTTLLEAARSQGWATGLVTTTRITHATPAAFVAKVWDRADEDFIARQVLNAHPDVLLGGGYDVLEPILASTAGNVNVLRSRDDLLTLIEDANSSYPVIGLFADSHMTYELLRDPTAEPSLAEMTVAALQLLDRHPLGFFVMIEAGRVDHASHDNLTAEVILEMAAFDEAVSATLNWLGDRQDVLIVVTADHETGGMEIAGSINQEIIQNPHYLAALPEQIMEELTTMSPVNVEAVFEPYGVVLEPGLPLILRRHPTPTLIRRALQQYVGVYWATVGHTGQDVPLYAFGPGADLFAGEQDNTEVAMRLAELAGLSIGGLDAK